MSMKFGLIFILLFLIIMSSWQAAGVEQNDTLNNSIHVGDVGNPPVEFSNGHNQEVAVPEEEDQHFDEFDALSDTVAEGVWDKGPTIAADNIYKTFGNTRGFIFSFVTYNINPESIPIAKDYNDKNQNMAIILAVLFLLGESMSSSMASANYPAYKNVFGEKDFSQKKYMGGGVSMIAGLGAAWIFRGVMILIDLIDAYLMLQVMDSIKPSLDTGIMYFAMAVMEALLFGFFLYRQVLIGAMYIASPVYGVMWASGYMKEFIDAIGDKFIRALIMQPLCIFITCVAIVIIKFVDWSMFGIAIWGADASIQLTMYAFLMIFLVGACIWCLTSKFTIIKRAAKIAVFKKVGY